MNSILRLRFPFTTVVDIFIAKYGGEHFTNKIELHEDDAAFAMYGTDRRCVAVGWVRNRPDWDDECLGLIIHPEHRGQGYGGLMLHFLETEAHSRGLERLRLHVHPKNHAARRLYERNYWYPYGIRENGEIVMYKVLRKELHGTKKK